LYVWSVYVLIIGALLSLSPNFMLSALGMEETQEVWIRVLGLVVVLLALYYWDAARNEAGHHFVATVLGRAFVAAGFVILVVTGEPWQFLIFAGLDPAGALWTLGALRAEAV
jgi:hypothetical protein